MNDRVRASSSQEYNSKIDQQTKASIDLYGSQSELIISNRIRSLEREWDIERALEVNMPVIALIGIALGAFVNVWWLILPTVVLLFFLQHALQGWCPPLPIFRKFGYRTKQEIAKEKYALKLLRGDFDGILSTSYTGPTAIYLAVSKT